LFALAFFCCDDDDGIPEPPPPPPVFNCEEVSCEPHEEFYGKCVMNQWCWIADGIFVDYSPSRMILTFGKNEVDGIGERLSIKIYSNTNLQDTIWIGTTDSGNPEPNIAPTYYGYTEDGGSAGTFNFMFGQELTYEDYLLIDYYNADTSIIEGQFQVRFPERAVNSYVNAPDTMRLSCGSFRVMRQ
jgi:hypothetical protein